MKTMWIIILSVLILISSTTTQRARSKRFVPVLVFPPTAPTRVQFIGGIGIPLENLKYEALTTGYVLKAEYALPSTAEQLRTRSMLPLNAPIAYGPFARGATSKRPLFENFLLRANELQQSSVKWLNQHKAVLTNYRWVVYKALEGLANRLGLAGRECVLKSICEVAEEPFDYANGIFAELLHILLTPSSSADEISEHTDNEYFYAESIGRSGAKCARVFKACPTSLLNRFSELRDLTENIGPFLRYT